MRSILKRIYHKAKREYQSRILLSHLKVTANCSKQWFGNDYGGFYVNPDLMDQNTIVYSFGIGEDISFDQAVIDSFSCQVHGFDPTPKSIKWCQNQSLPDSFHFHDVGIDVKTGKVVFHLPENENHVSGSVHQHANVSDSNKVEVQMKSFLEITNDLNHKEIGFLKMDIEGSEYNVIDSILDSDVTINQMAIEIHDRFFEKGSKKSAELVKKMSIHGYEIFAISESKEEISFIKMDLIS
ncbi:MAG: FkbM family methyltransferase [Glaciecola sp.]|jgi:FkbM family methyltransferase